MILIWPEMKSENAAARACCGVLALLLVYLDGHVAISDDYSTVR